MGCGFDDPSLTACIQYTERERERESKRDGIEWGSFFSRSLIWPRVYQLGVLNDSGQVA